jgi:hypothetical protein
MSEPASDDMALQLSVLRQSVADMCTVELEAQNSVGSGNRAFPDIGSFGEYSSFVLYHGLLQGSAAEKLYKRSLLGSVTYRPRSLARYTVQLCFLIGTQR